MSKNQALGASICTVCVALATASTVVLFWPTLEVIRLWLVTIPVLIAFIFVLSIGAWIGWTIATTPSPKPIEEIQSEQTEARALLTIDRIPFIKKKTRGNYSLFKFFHEFFSETI